MTSRDKFQIGQRVRLTPAGRALYRHGRSGPRCFGTVLRFGGARLAEVVIQIDSLKVPRTFHMDFWTPDVLELQHD